jgi:NADH dehydrogenase [ubiquinone] 1 alpha subcomplex assembly factor 6
LINASTHLTYHFNMEDARGVLSSMEFFDFCGEIRSSSCKSSLRRLAKVSGSDERAYYSTLLTCNHRKYDSPTFVLKAFIPPSAQDAYIALRAFNIDVARVADTTNNTSIGAMRMQFWRDAVTKSLAGSPPKNPVAILLAAAAEDLQRRTQGRSKLSKNWLLRIINTREQYLGNSPYSTLSALENYAESTYSTLLYLTLSTMPLTSVTADHLASHIGKATGIAAVLRGLPLIAFPPPPPTHHSSNAIGGPRGSAPQGAVLLPLDVMAETGLQEEEVFRQGGSAPNLREAVFTVATRANDHLITAREMLKNLKGGLDVGHEFEHAGEEEHIYSPQDMNAGTQKQLEEVKRGFGVLMPAISTALWLEKLQKVDFDVFDSTLRKTDWKLIWRAYWAYKRGIL